MNCNCKHNPHITDFVVHFTRPNGTNHEGTFIVSVMDASGAVGDGLSLEDIAGTRRQFIIDAIREKLERGR